MTEHLNEEQIARLEALQGASQILGRKSEGAFKAVSYPDIPELVDVAEYIVNGIHPMDRYGDAPNVQDA
jgi:hypothetical protein